MWTAPQQTCKVSACQHLSTFESNCKQKKGRRLFFLQGSFFSRHGPFNRCASEAGHCLCTGENVLRREYAALSAGRGRKVGSRRQFSRESESSRELLIGQLLPGRCRWTLTVWLGAEMLRGCGSAYFPSSDSTRPNTTCTSRRLETDAPAPPKLIKLLMVRFIGQIYIRLSKQFECGFPDGWTLDYSPASFASTKYCIWVSRDGIGCILNWHVDRKVSRKTFNWWHVTGAWLSTCPARLREQIWSGHHSRCWGFLTLIFDSTASPLCCSAKLPKFWLDNSRQPHQVSIGQLQVVQIYFSYLGELSC